MNSCGGQRSRGYQTLCNRVELSMYVYIKRHLVLAWDKYDPWHEVGKPCMYSKEGCAMAIKEGGMLFLDHKPQGKSGVGFWCSICIDKGLGGE